LVVAVPEEASIKQLFAKVEHEYSVQQTRVAQENTPKPKVRCLSIFLREVFEICDHRTPVKNLLTDYMEVSITAKFEPAAAKTEKPEK